MAIRIAVAWAWLLYLPALTPGAVRAAPAETLRKAGDFTVRPYTLTAPGGHSVEAELWRLAVPEDRHKGTSRLIEIAFVRLKSTAKRPGPPLVYLAGGPGGSGIGAVRGPALPLLLALQEAGDVVLLDQRGTGISRPVLESALTWDAPLDKPGDPALLLRVWKDRLRAAARPFTREGISLSAYNPAEAADDVEAVRVALGVRELNLWGISYGTYLALATVRRHEQSIHRAILTGVVGPDQAYLTRPAHLQAQLEQVHRLLKEDENARKAVPDLLGSLRTLLDRLEKKPVAVEITDPHTKETVRVVVGKWDLQFFLAKRIGRTYSLKGLPGFCAPLFRGDLRPLAREALAFRRGKVGSLMGWHMLGSSGGSTERVRLVEREAPGTLLGDTVNFPFPTVAAALTVQDFGPVFRARLRSAVPVLFISGTLDGNTPLANVTEIQDSFADHTHLIVEGASHGYDLFYFAPGLKERMLEFLSGRPLSALRINLLPFRFDPVKEVPPP